MQGIYKILNKSKNENTFYFELCSGCATFVYDYVVGGSQYSFAFFEIV